MSVTSSGIAGSGPSYYPSISADGRYVAFISEAPNLVLGDNSADAAVIVHDRQTAETSRLDVEYWAGFAPCISEDGRYVAFDSPSPYTMPGDTNASKDVFVHDRTTGMTICASLDASGTMEHGGGDAPSMSADGRYVAFRSIKNRLVNGDFNNVQDIFVHDTQTRLTRRVSISSSGVSANGYSDGPTISADGRIVGFHSVASNLVANDSTTDDVFVHELSNGSTSRVSLDSLGNRGNGRSYWPRLSGDGRYVAFHSAATNLVPGDVNGVDDLFVHDRHTRQTACVSVSSSGELGNGQSMWPSLSSNGRFVVFRSLASNLVPEDTNGLADVFVHDWLPGTPGTSEDPYPEPTATAPPMKPAIVLVAGLNEDYGFKSPEDPSHTWHDVYSYLKHQKGYEVYVVPSRMNAATPGVVDSLGGYTGDNAYQVQRYLEGQGLKNRDVIIIGHSMGGLIARKWAGSRWLWGESGLNPKAIVQLGTPNAGSPLPVIERLGTYGKEYVWGDVESFTPSQASWELDQHQPIISRFNDSYRNSAGVPVLRLGGEFFPSSAAHQALWPFNPAQALTNAILKLAFGSGAPNDGAVSTASLLAGPTAGSRGSEFFPVMHSDAGGLFAFTLGANPPGFIVPKDDTPVEDKILERIYGFCEDVRRGRIKATPLAASSTVLGSRSSSSVDVSTIASDSETGNAFATITDEMLSLSADMTSTVDFSVEGTSAVVEVACADPSLRVAVKNVGQIIPSEMQFIPSGRAVAFGTSPGGSYSLELRSASTTTAAVSVLDGGHTALVVDTQASGAGGSDVLVTARLKRDSSNLAGSFIARVDGGSTVPMSDNGTSADVTASDRVYSASVRLPVSGMAARVTVEASATGGIQRTGFGLTEIIEPRATISGTPTLSKGLTPSGKVGQVFVDVPVAASMDCTVQVASDLGPAGVLVAQSTSQTVLVAGSSSSARVVFDAEDLDAMSEDVSAVLASINLYDSTDGGLSLLDSATSAPMALSNGDLALASCTIDAFGKPVNSDPVLMTGAASCTSETIAGIDISLDGGNEWLVVPEPVSGWGSHDVTWSCAFTLSEGEYGALVRLRGANGPIAGATDSLAFSVDRTAPTGTMSIANGAQFVPRIFSIDSSVTGATEMRVRSSTDGTTWGAWSDWAAYQTSIAESVATMNQEWRYQLEYRDEAGNVLVLTDDVTVDATAPLTTSNGKSVYDLSASIKLAASDGAMSGIAKTEWRLDGGNWTTGTLVSTTKAGDRVLEFRSVDKAGNVESPRVLKFRVRPKASVGTPVAPSMMSRSKYYTVSGYLKPRHAVGSYPVRIYRYRYVSGAWKAYGYVTARASNYSTYTKYSRSVSLPYAGRWRLRAYAPADSWHVATWSSGYDYVTVK